MSAEDGTLRDQCQVCIAGAHPDQAGAQGKLGQHVEALILYTVWKESPHVKIRFEASNIPQDSFSISLGSAVETLASEAEAGLSFHVGLWIKTRH